MTPDEWRQVADEVKSLWGKSQRWANAPDAYRFAADIPAAAAHQAVQHVFLENRKTTPAPADVLAAARGFITDAATTEQIASYCTASNHLWAIVNDSGGIRTVVCARCNRTEEGPSHRYPTEAELEDGVFAGVTDRTGDRIAP